MDTDPRPPLTRRQTAILSAIRDSVRERGYPPSVRELIGGTVGLTSTSSVAHQLRQLEAKGYIQKPVHGHPRALTILHDTEDAQRTLRLACRELINASLAAVTEDSDAVLRQGRAWDAMALALDAAEDAR